MNHYLCHGQDGSSVLVRAFHLAAAQGQLRKARIVPVLLVELRYHELQLCRRKGVKVLGEMPKLSKEQRHTLKCLKRQCRLMVRYMQRRGRDDAVMDQFKLKDEQIRRDFGPEYAVYLPLL